jgi:hypothetical protein
MRTVGLLFDKALHVGSKLIHEARVPHNSGSGRVNLLVRSILQAEIVHRAHPHHSAVPSQAYGHPQRAARTGRERRGRRVVAMLERLLGVPRLVHLPRPIAFLSWWLETIENGVQKLSGPARS